MTLHSWMAALARSSFAVLLAGSVWAVAAERPGSKEEWERTLGEARKEGRVVVYGSAGVDREKVYREHFEAAFPGIRVFYTPTAAGGDAKLLAERRAQRFIPDITISGVGLASAVRSFIAQEVFQPFRRGLILPEVTDESRWFEGKLWFADKGEHIFIPSLNAATMIAVNTQLINPGEIVSYTQLLDPKWRGKIVTTDFFRAGGGVAGSSYIKFLYARLGPGFLKRLYGEMEVALSRDNRQMVDWLAQGRFPIFLFPLLNDIDYARERGLPVDVVNPQQMKEGYSLTPANHAIRVMNPAPHPHAARVFLNWLLSRDGQTAFESVMKAPSLRVDTATKSSLRDFLVPRKGGNYMIPALEQHWHLDPEIEQLLKSLLK